MRPYEAVQDRERPYETVQDRIYTTVHDVHTMSELNRLNMVYKLYGIELKQKSVGPCVIPVNVQLIE